MEGAGGIGGWLARSSGYSGGNWSTHYFYHADGNGNITYLVDSSQALAASYRYDSFGNTLSSSGLRRQPMCTGSPARRSMSTAGCTVTAIGFMIPLCRG